MRKTDPNIKAIFFDLGGVIIDGPPANARAHLREACRKWMGSNAERVDACLHDACDGTRTTPHAVKWISRALRLPVAARRQVRYILSTAWYERGARINKNVLQFAHSLKGHYIVGVISDTLPIHTKVNIRWGVFKGFRPVVLSHRVGSHKPQPRIYRYALNAARVSPSESIFIDDRKDKLAGAIRVGMHGILFKNIRQLKRDLKKLGVSW